MDMDPQRAWDQESREGAGARGGGGSQDQGRCGGGSGAGEKGSEPGRVQRLWRDLVKPRCSHEPGVRWGSGCGGIISFFYGD